MDDQYGPVGSGVHAASFAWKVGEPLHRLMDNYNNGMLCARIATSGPTTPVTRWSGHRGVFRLRFDRRAPGAVHPVAPMLATLDAVRETLRQ